jgi:hypothetical protein
VKFAFDANNDLDHESFSGSDLLTLKVPLTLPYTSDSQEFERVSGEFEHQGDVYRLYKQKLYRDTLYIVCVKDVSTKKINQALVDYVKTFADKPQNSKQSAGKETPTLIKDYLSCVILIESEHYGWENPIKYCTSTDQYTSRYSYRIKYPPKAPFSIPFS